MSSMVAPFSFCVAWHDSTVIYILSDGPKILIAIWHHEILNLLFDCSQVIIVDGSQDSQSRLPTSIKNFSFSQKEKTLNELIQDRWLSNTSTGKIGLGTRSFLDLRSWFRSNDIPSCVVCNEACIKVLTCDDLFP